MSSISWTSTTGGNWNTGSNWSGGQVPGAQDDVTINTSQSITVTFSSGSDTVLSLYTGNPDTLLMTGGKLGITGNSLLHGTVSESGGTLTLGGNQNYMYDGLQQTAGTVKISAGTLTIAYNSSIGGSITGAALNLSSGTDTIAAGAALSVAELELTGASVTLGKSLTQAGLFDMTTGTLTLGTNNLTLSGPASLIGGVMSGSGTVALSGATELNSGAFEGNLKVINSGTIDQTGNDYIGYNGTDSVTFTNTATGLWRIDGDVQVLGNANTAIVNLGTIDKAGGSGVAYIHDSLNSSGTITVASGDLQLVGPSNIIGGTVSGGGTLDLAGGTDTLSAGLSLSVGTVLMDGANVTLAGNLSYDGTLSASSGTFSVGLNTLTLGGPTELDGGVFSGAGSIVFGGATQINGGYLIGSLAASNTGTIDQSYYFYIGYFGTDTVTFTNAAHALYQLEGGNTIYASTGSSFINAGSFVKTSAAASTVNASFKSTGTVAVNEGVLLMQGASNSFAGTVSGGGTLALNGTADSFAKGLKLTVGSLLLEAGTLTLASKLVYSNLYEQTGGTLTLGKAAFTLKGVSTTLDNGFLAGQGTLALRGGTVSQYVLENTSTLSNTGTLVVNGYLYDGYNSADAARIANTGAASAIILNENAYISATAGSTLTNAGLIDKASGSGVSVIEASMSSTGKLEVITGTLSLTGASDSIAGSVSGGGTLEAQAGTVTLATGLSLTVGNLLLNGATVLTAGSLSYAGSLYDAGGTFTLGAGTLALTGPFEWTNGFINGTGTLTTAGTTTITGGALSGLVVMQNSGTIVQAGSWYVGYGASDTTQLQNLAAGTVRLENGSNIYGDAGSLFTNAGTLVKIDAASSQISVNFNDTGTVTITDGLLSIAGTTSNLGGTFNGGGSLRLSAGTDTIAAGTSLGVGSLTLGGATMILSGAETYAGVFSDSGGTLSLGANQLTLSGSADFYNGVVNGSGTLALSGAIGSFGTWELEGSVVADNTGTLTVQSSFYDGYNSTDTASLHNLAGGDIVLSSVEIYQQSGDALVNAGTISKALGGFGEGAIQGAVTNTGTISVTEGTLAFIGAVSGNGQFSIGSASDMIFNSAVTGGGTVTMGSFTDLGLSATGGFADTIAGFTTGDVLDLNGMSYTGTSTTLSFDAAHDKLTVSNGSLGITLQLSGAETASAFTLFNDNGTVAVGHT